MNNDTTVWTGMDVHKDKIAVCWVVGQGQKEETAEILNEERSIRKLMRSLGKLGEVRACYEAGPCGYAVRRFLTKLGVSCEVIAPALMPRMPGDRVKTDQRDARKLARFYRSGDLTVIRIPTEQEEAVRGLVRCREDFVEDLHRPRQRVLKLLLQQGRVWRDGKNWTNAHWQWLRTQSFEQEATQRTFNEYLETVAYLTDRLAQLDKEVEALAEKEPWKSQVGLLCCLRGIKVVSAMTLLVEIIDFRRFKTPRELMSFLGVTPSLYSSASTRREGSITKAGNAHARRILVEASWHYRHQPQLPATLRKRCEGQPEWVIAQAREAQDRLNYRFRRLVAKGKKKTVAVVAVARELAGFIWALLVKGPEAGVRPPRKNRSIAQATERKGARQARLQK